MFVDKIQNVSYSTWKVSNLRVNATEKYLHSSLFYYNRVKLEYLVKSILSTIVCLQLPSSGIAR